MALANYITVTRQLLQPLSSPTPLVADGVLTTYINLARGRIAAEGECVRVYATLPTVTDQAQYKFADIDVSGTDGVAGVNSIRSLWIAVPDTQLKAWKPSRPFEWYGLYATYGSGQPSLWAQFGQGQAGSLFFDPVPDQVYTCSLDVVGVPKDLAADGDTEVIPPLWTDAVPFYGAWYALISLQRQQQADRVFQRAQELMGMARGGATPGVLPAQQPQAPDQTLPNKLAASGGR